MRSLVILSLLAIAFAQQTAYFCEVGVPDFCSGGNSPCPLPPTFGSDTPSDILYVKQSSVNTYGFDQFNVISFRDFNGQSDTEGRVAVAGSFSVTAGYSIGDKIWTMGPGHTDNQLPYSLIVGGNLNWPSGALFPAASNNAFLSYQENMFVQGSVTAPDYLASSDRSDSALAASIANDFAQAKIYYSNLQAAFAAVADNVAFSVLSNGNLNIVCRSAAATSYSLTIDATEFNRVRDYTFSTQCNSEVQIVINIAGSGDVVFSGNNIAESIRAEIVLFNILGSGRRITVAGASVRGNVLAPNNIMNTVNGGYIQGFQVYGNVENSRQINRVNCMPPAPVPHPPANTHLCPRFEQSCSGLDITLPSPAPQDLFSFRDCNVVSFTDFVADTGDVEGRVCVARDFIAGDGYTVGYELSTNNDLPDRSVPAALIAGRDCSWASGSLHPDGTGIPHPGAREDAFCGRTFSGSADLRSRASMSCATTGCLDTIFNNAHTCYNGFSDSYANLADNVQAGISFSGLFLTCADPTASQYVFSMTPELMAQYTYIVTIGCNFQAYWVMNVRGTSDVLFTGDFLAVPSGAVLVNVIGSRTVYVQAIRLNAHLLAPRATLNQTGGVIIGKVVANNIVHALQINHQNTCPDLTTIQVPIVPITPGTTIPDVPAIPHTPVPSPDTPTGPPTTPTGPPTTPTTPTTPTPMPPTPTPTPDTDLPPAYPPAPNCIDVMAAVNFRIGDEITLITSDSSTVSTAITEVNDNSICVGEGTQGLPEIYYTRVSGYASVKSNDGRKTTPNPTKDSSSSVVGVTFALFALVALFI